MTRHYLRTEVGVLSSKGVTKTEVQLNMRASSPALTNLSSHRTLSRMPCAGTDRDMSALRCHQKLLRRPCISGGPSHARPAALMGSSAPRPLRRAGLLTPNHAQQDTPV